MPKGYIDFDTFKSQHKTKPRIPRCPRCKKPMIDVMINRYGKVMCGDCFSVEVNKMEAARKRKEAKEIEHDKEISEDTFTIEE